VDVNTDMSNKDLNVSHVPQYVKNVTMIQTLVVLVLLEELMLHIVNVQWDTMKMNTI
jgi:hypothetical protein